MFPNYHGLIKIGDGKESLMVDSPEIICKQKDGTVFHIKTKQRISHGSYHPEQTVINEAKLTEGNKIIRWIKMEGTTIQDNENKPIAGKQLPYPNTNELIELNNKLPTKFKLAIMKETLRSLLEVLVKDDQPIILEFKDNDKPIEFTDNTTSGLLVPMLIKETNETISQTTD